MSPDNRFIYNRLAELCGSELGIVRELKPWIEDMDKDQASKFRLVLEVISQRSLGSTSKLTSENQKLKREKSSLTSENHKLRRDKNSLTWENRDLKRKLLDLRRENSRS